MSSNSNKLIEVIKSNQSEINSLISQKPDWNIAKEKMNNLFSCLANPNDNIWSDETFQTLKKVYFQQRDSDNCSSNITIRTLNGISENLKNDIKIIFLQIADCCTFFNASQKVNFSPEEMPEHYEKIQMISSKQKGLLTYKIKTPSIYEKISLTFDYWVPKILEWTEEIRNNGFKDWQGKEIFGHESCTDFMRISLLFLSDFDKNLPIAKADDRQKILDLLGEEFVWIKKSAKREDIIENNKKLLAGLKELNIQTGIEIPLESWNRVLYSSYMKPLIK